MSGPLDAHPEKATKHRFRGAARVCAHLEDLSPDGREHRHRDRQRTHRTFGALGAVDGEALSVALRSTADAST